MASVIYISGALFQGIAYQPVMLMIIGLQIGLDSYCKRIESERARFESGHRGSPPSKRAKSRPRPQSDGDQTGDAVTA